MLRPSYTELMERLNEGSNVDSKVTSRYIIVIAAAKRARQLIDGELPLASCATDKPVSIAVNELYEGKLQISTESESGGISGSYFDEFQNETKRKILASNETTGDIFIDDEYVDDYDESDEDEEGFEDEIDGDFEELEEKETYEYDKEDKYEPYDSEYEDDYDDYDEEYENKGGGRSGHSAHGFITEDGELEEDE